jgi:hypothetical protein
MTTPILPKPDHIFEAAFTTVDDGQVWSNLTDYIELQEGLKVSKRRSSVFDEVAPATLNLALDNSAGTFNNDKVTSPYFGKVLIDVPSRLRFRWPNVPTATANMLSDIQSAALDTMGFQPDQGSLGLDVTIAPVTYDDGNVDTYTGVWTTRTDANDFGGSCQETATNGNTAVFTFTGTKVTWLAEKFTDHGITNVSIDGGTNTAVDLYNASRLYQQPVFVASGLAPTQHTIKLTVTNTKNALATAFICSVDAFIVESVATPPSGQASDLVWNTGVLDTTGVQVLTGLGQAPNRIPDDEEPIYVKPSTSYSARLQVKGDAASVALSFGVRCRIRWYDALGVYISDSDSAATTTLTTAYQAVSVTATSPANAASARMGVVTQTLVPPGTRLISWNGGDNQTTNYGTSRSVIVPQNAMVGDVCLAWIRTNNPSVTLSAHADWTFVNSWADTKGKTWLYRRSLVATDPGKKYAFSTGSVKCGIQVGLTNYSHVNQTTPIHQINEVTETVFRATHTTPSVTTTIANCLILSACFDTSSTTTVWGAPGGEQIRNLLYRTGGNSPTGLVTDNAAIIGAGTYGAKVMTSNSSSKGATMHTLALAQAASTGPGSVTLQMSALEFVAGSLGTWQQGGNWEDLFKGLTDSWQTEYQGDLTLTRYAATDRQKQLATINVQSALYESIRAQYPVAYYKLDEASNGTNILQQAANSADIVQDAMTPRQFGTGGTVNWAQGTGPAVDGSSAVMLAPVDRFNGLHLTTTLINPIAGSNGVTMMCYWNSTLADANVRAIMGLQDRTVGKNPRCLIQIAATPTVSLYADCNMNSEGTTVYRSSSKAGSFFDGKTHHLAATYQITGGQLVISLYIDGTLQVTGGTATTLSQFPTLAVATVGGQYPGGYIGAGTYSHAAFYNGVLDADTIADIAQAGSNAFAGDTIDARMARLCTWEGQDTSNFDQTDTITARHMPDAVSLQDALRQAARSEGGSFYVAGSGALTFKSRDTKQLTSVPLITIKAQQVDPSAFLKVTDDSLMINNPQVKIMSTGVVTQLTDPVSKGLHGTKTREFDTILAATSDALDYATYILAFYSNGGSRCDQVHLEGLLMQDWLNVLNIDIWRMLRITGLPSSEQVSTLDLYIEGFEINITPDSWGLTFDTSMAIPFLVVNDPTRGICGASVVAW